MLSRLLLPVLSIFSVTFTGCEFLTNDSVAKQVTEKTQNSWPKAKPEFLSQCGSELTQTDYEELLELTDVSTFESFAEANGRAERIAEVFSNAKDRRGIFSSMYVEITHESVRTSGVGQSYENPTMAKALVKQFAKRYFEPLHLHLLSGSEDPAAREAWGKPRPGIAVTEWQTYYDLAAECDTSDLRILGTGVNNHMTVDLPYALAEIQSPDNFYDDFILFGNILIEKKEESTNLLIEQQNVYAAAFFDLFFLGKFIDAFGRVGQAATWGFQAIRAEAWNNRSFLLRFEQTLNPNFKTIRAQWFMRQETLQVSPHSDENHKGTWQIFPHSPELSD